MRIIGLSVAAALGAALYLLPVVEAAAQTKMCAAKPTKPAACAEWTCKKNEWCQVAGTLPSSTGCTAWACNAMERGGKKKKK